MKENNQLEEKNSVGTQEKIEHFLKKIRNGTIDILQAPLMNYGGVNKDVLDFYMKGNPKEIFGSTIEATPFIGFIISAYIAKTGVHPFTGYKLNKLGKTLRYANFPCALTFNYYLVEVLTGNTEDLSSTGGIIFAASGIVSKILMSKFTVDGVINAIDQKKS